MDTYQKIRFGMLIAAITISVIAGALGITLRPLDEIGGGSPI